MSALAPLRGKTALVTGSTSGIGLCIAHALAGRGASVLMNGFGDVDAALSAVRDAAAPHGARVLHHGADVSSPSEVEAMLRYASDVFGGVDILVNNAGVQFHTTRLALPHMRARDWGRILNVASVHGLVASAQKSAYVAAKHGLVGLTKVVALETARTGVTCNAICPGWVLTPLVQQQVDARAAREGTSLDHARDALVSEKQPSGDFVAPEQLAELALFLCSDAASQVRGVAWNVDGGWLAQ